MFLKAIYSLSSIPVNILILLLIFCPIQFQSKIMTQTFLPQEKPTFINFIPPPLSVSPSKLIHKMEFAHTTILD
jgi:hypothetical protein